MLDYIQEENIVQAIRLKEGMSIALEIIDKENLNNIIENPKSTLKYIEVGNYLNVSGIKVTPYDVCLTKEYFIITSVEYHHNWMPLFIQKIWNKFSFKFPITVTAKFYVDKN